MARRRHQVDPPWSRSTLPDCVDHASCNRAARTLSCYTLNSGTTLRTASSDNKKPGAKKVSGTQVAFNTARQLPCCLLAPSPIRTIPSASAFQETLVTALLLGDE